MSEIKANHICKNPNCKKHYYACNFCDKTQSWKSVACSFACYQKYMDLVIEERSKGKIVEVKPERTDMTEKEVDILLNRPLEEIVEETKTELSEYADINGDVNFAKAVDEINVELDKKKKTTICPKSKNSKDE